MEDLEAAVARVREDAAEAVAGSVSPQVNRILERLVPRLLENPDYAETEARGPINAVLFHLLRFLEYRLDTTRGHDPAAAYLFADTERAAVQHVPKAAPPGPGRNGSDGKGGTPKADRRDEFERALQLDCMHVMRAGFGGGVRLEMSDVAGGRADIFVAHGCTNLVVEVKREDDDASGEALLAKYGNQAAEYSNTSARVGFLLVLDRSRPDGSAGHIEDKISLHRVTKPGDKVARTLVVVVMPGRRRRPSAL